MRSNPTHAQINSYPGGACDRHSSGDGGRGKPIAAAARTTLPTRIRRCNPHSPRAGKNPQDTKTIMFPAAFDPKTVSTAL